MSLTSQDLDIAGLLKSWKLERYVENFEKEGYDDPSDWSELIENNGSKLAENNLIDKAGHRTRFIRNFKDSKWYKNEDKFEEKDNNDNKEDINISDETSAKPLSIAKKEKNKDGFYIIPSGITHGTSDDEKNNTNNNSNNKKIISTNRHKVILMVGETGSGKTTTINSMVNYMYNVKYNNVFRYKLIEEKEKEKGQAESQTDNVISYHLEHHRKKEPCQTNLDPQENKADEDNEKENFGTALNYDLTIVDTPGFGDTRGVQRDIEIMKDIKKWFETKLDTLDAICFVIKSSDARLTYSQRYIFQQVKNIFGKDVEHNILVLVTHCDDFDAPEPSAIKTLKEEEIPFVKYFKFNNSVYFKDPINKSKHGKQIDSVVWNMGYESFKSFFNTLDSTQPVSLQLTRDVLRYREYLKVKN